MFEFFIHTFSKVPILAVLFVAMFPTLESKVALPLAMSTQIWGEQAFSPFVAFVIAFVGSMLPAGVVIVLTRLIKNKTSGFVHDKFISKIESKYKKSFDKLQQKNTTLKKCMMLAMFVAIPLPLTGVYTGSLIAGFTNLKFWQAYLSIFVGEIFSCLVVLLLCTVFENSTFYIFIISLVFVALYLFANLLIYLFKAIRNRVAIKKKRDD